MKRSDGNSYTTEQEALDMCRECVEFAKQRGLSMPGFVQQRGKEDYLVTPVEYHSYKTLHVLA